MRDLMREIITDWRTDVLGGLVILSLTVAGVALGVERPLRAAAQMGVGLFLILFGLRKWQRQLSKAKQRRA